MTPSRYGKENAASRRAAAPSPAPTPSTRKPLVAVTPRYQQTPAKPNASATEEVKEKRRSRVLGDVSNARKPVDNTVSTPARIHASGSKRATGKSKEKPKDSVRARVIEWEREKERLREMARLEELERERDEQIAAEAEIVEEEIRATSPVPVMEVKHQASDAQLSESNLRMLDTMLSPAAPARPLSVLYPDTPAVPRSHAAPSPTPGKSCHVMSWILN